VALGTVLGGAPGVVLGITLDAIFDVVLDEVTDVMLSAVLNVAVDVVWAVASGAVCAALDVLDEVYDVVLGAVFDLESNVLLILALVLLQEVQPTDSGVEAVAGAALVSNILHNNMLASHSYRAHRSCLSHLHLQSPSPPGFLVWLCMSNASKGKVVVFTSSLSSVRSTSNFCFIYSPCVPSSAILKMFHILPGIVALHVALVAHLRLSSRY
jgi:hypothetical protein